MGGNSIAYIIAPLKSFSTYWRYTNKIIIIIIIIIIGQITAKLAIVGRHRRLVTNIILQNATSQDTGI